MRISYLLFILLLLTSCGTEETTEDSIQEETTPEQGTIKEEFKPEEGTVKEESNP